VTNTEELIDQIPLFRGLPEGQRTKLARVAVKKVYERGQAIFFEGELAHGFFVTLKGRVKIFKLSPEGKEQILHIIEKWEPFGEVPVFEGTSFPAHAEALQETETLFFPRSAFAALIREDPSLSMNMLAILSRRLKQFTVLVEHLSLKEVPQRLAAFILYLAENQKTPGRTVDLNITKGQLASLLGTIPETLSRILSRMATQGFLRLEGRKIAILDAEGLRDLAAGGRLFP
jgi:CRP/FNR family transcriptional regulator, dissimilatory nitrate respiration regulator